MTNLQKINLELKSQKEKFTALLKGKRLKSSFSKKSVFSLFSNKDKLIFSPVSISLFVLKTLKNYKLFPVKRNVLLQDYYFEMPFELALRK